MNAAGRAPSAQRILIATLIAVACALASYSSAYAQQLEKLTIVTAGGGRQTFEVEVMRNDADRARGLMFRRMLPADRGMLFDFGREEEVSMWMQNTYIPLDMLFIRADGVIRRIAANTEPLSTRTIPSGGPALGVLEINGGEAAKRGIKPGDRVEHPLFGGK
ncbi:MAG: hypothetical protein BGP06_07735 [Rhizobiales bacterium 65-9]|nr:DUF192 domain-containing protein [Hyphomicrobiales bacterium]OJY35688.1 MAG: hypothetical protein BGP06_07735 [Rhizobiales bacterium 65-9]